MKSPWSLALQDENAPIIVASFLELNRHVTVFVVLSSLVRWQAKSSKKCVWRNPIVKRKTYFGVHMSILVDLFICSFGFLLFDHFYRSNQIDSGSFTENKRKMHDWQWSVTEKRKDERLSESWRQLNLMFRLKIRFFQAVKISSIGDVQTLKNIALDKTEEQSTQHRRKKLSLFLDFLDW